MKKLSTLLVGVCLYAAPSFSQVTINTSGTPLNTQANATAIVVDNALTITSNVMLDGAKASIANGFQNGDELNYTGTLPDGVSASYDENAGILTFAGSASADAYQDLLRTVTFRTNSANLAQRKVLFNLGTAIAFSGNGHYYEYIFDELDWASAKAAAENRNLYGLQGYLATITSQDENDFIQQKLSADGWLGGSDDYGVLNTTIGTTYEGQGDIEGHFFWVTGPEKGQAISVGNAPAPITPWNGAFIYWNDGEPNNWNNTNENYIQIYSSGAVPGRWNDLPNESSLGYVVEYGGMNNDPAVVLSAARTIFINGVLPVNGLRFQVSNQNQIAVLNWSTEFEQETSHFEVMHSTNGAIFSTVGKVTAAQNSSTSRAYTFAYNGIAAGTNYFKLAIVDRNGHTTLSDVKQLVIKSKLQVFPNPASTQIVVSNPFKGMAQLLVKNTVGASLIQQQVVQSGTSVDISSLPAGIYFLQLQQGTTTSETIRLIKK